MAGEYASGWPLKQGAVIKGFKVEKVLSFPGNAWSAKARASSGELVFLKKYTHPGASAPWYDAFVSYQNELKSRIQADKATRILCYGFNDFFEIKGPPGPLKQRAFYQVFEWIEGGMNLRDVINKFRSDPNEFSWDQRVVFARIMLAGVWAIHKAGIIHTDLKPENLYLVPADIPVGYVLKIIDMDFSIIEGTKAPWIGHGEGFFGTEGYLSPEHVTKKVPQKASDVFTCGLILGELLGGGHPAVDDMDAYEERVKTGSLRPISIQQPVREAPDGAFVSFVINATLRPDAAKRPSADQVLWALRGQLNEFDGKKPRSGGVVSRAAPKPDRVTVVPPKLVPSRGEVPKPEADMSLPATPSGIATITSDRIFIIGPAGQRLTVSLAAKFGKVHFKTWHPDFEKYMAEEQFRLFKNTTGTWMIEHCAGAKNATVGNAKAITTSTVVTSGMVVALGKTGKCPLTMTLI